MNSIDFPEASLLPVLFSDGWAASVKEGYRKTILKIQNNRFWTIYKKKGIGWNIATASQPGILKYPDKLSRNLSLNNY